MNVDMIKLSSVYWTVGNHRHEWCERVWVWVWIQVWMWVCVYICVVCGCACECVCVFRRKPLQMPLSNFIHSLIDSNRQSTTVIPGWILHPCMTASFSANIQSDGHSSILYPPRFDYFRVTFYIYIYIYIKQSYLFYYTWHHFSVFSYIHVVGKPND